MNGGDIMSPVEASYRFWDIGDAEMIPSFFPTNSMEEFHAS